MTRRASSKSRAVSLVLFRACLAIPFFCVMGVVLGIVVMIALPFLGVLNATMNLIMAVRFPEMINERFGRGPSSNISSGSGKPGK